MSEWREYKLGEISSFITEKVSVQEVGIEDYVSTENMLADKGGITTASSKPTEGSATKYYTDTILISNIRPYFKKIWYANKGGGCSNDVLCFKAKEGVADSKYLYFLLSQDIFFDYVMLGSKGCKMPRGDKSHIMNWEISLPPLNVQRRIAAILSSLDDKIDLLHRENATLEQMAETLFRQWFVVEAKEEWEEKELREIVDISIGRTPPRKEAKWFSTNPNDVKWLSIKDMGAGDVFLFNTSEYLTKEAVETYSIPIIPKNTVVLSFKMTVGRVGITTEDMLSNEAIAHFKFTNKTPITKEYLYLFLKSFKYESLGSTSSIVTAINSAMIKKMQIIIPDDVIMKKFEKQTQCIFSKIYSNQKQIQTLIQMRDGLLPRLMNKEISM